jgi:hypothetical protein
VEGSHDGTAGGVMPKDFVLPELAESVVEGEIVKWLVRRARP